MGAVLDGIAAQAGPHAAQRLGQCLAHPQVLVQLDHDGHGGGVVQRDDAGDDPGRAQRQQGADEADSSSAPVGARTPDSQLDSTSR